MSGQTAEVFRLIGDPRNVVLRSAWNKDDRIPVVGELRSTALMPSGRCVVLVWITTAVYIGLSRLI